MKTTYIHKTTRTLATANTLPPPQPDIPSAGSSTAATATKTTAKAWTASRA